jgi:hypothetical protein
MTKEEALSSIEQLQQRAEELKAFVAAAERSESATAEHVAKRFVTADGATGAMLMIPFSVTDPSMSIMEYLMRDFMRRGGKLYDAESRIKRWSKMRFALHGRLCDAWNGSCAKTFRALPEQPTVGELLGQSFVWLVDTNEEIETHGGTSFIELMDEKVDVINPMAFMTLMLTVPDVANPSTYLSFKDWRWEWIAAVDEDVAAYGYSYSDGLYARWDDPVSSYSNSRARPVVRSHA